MHSKAKNNHQSNLQNRTIYCRDNIDVLQNINSESVDLIYLDPPFNKKKTFTAPLGSSAEGASFKDIFTEKDLKQEWFQTIKEDHDQIFHLLEATLHMEGQKSAQSYNFCYLAYMAIRLIECQRILKETGSLYLHCDPTMSHYLKLLLDSIFGEKNFRNEIVWCYSRPSAPRQRQLSRVHDVIFWYSRGKEWCFNADAIRQPYAPSSLSREGYAASASKVASESVELNPKGKFPESWIYIPMLKGNSTESTGYPTQKPLALLERIIRASSKEGDMVLDPFCGCATTCVAAEKLGRQWVGIDVSHRAYELVQERLTREIQLSDPLFNWNKNITYLTYPPQRTDRGVDYREKKYVYIISLPHFSHRYNANGEKETWYKVGVAKDKKTRLGNYQTGDPDRAYEVEYSVLTPKFRELEAHIHHVFPNRDEWVNASLEEIQGVMDGF